MHVPQQHSVALPPGHLQHISLACQLEKLAFLRAIGISVLHACSRASESACKCLWDVLRFLVVPVEPSKYQAMAVLLMNYCVNRSTPTKFRGSLFPCGQQQARVWSTEDQQLRWGVATEAGTRLSLSESRSSPHERVLRNRAILVAGAFGTRAHNALRRQLVSQPEGSV